MSWGSAKHRDERRKVALENLKRHAKEAELAVQKAKHKRLNASAMDKDAAGKDVVYAEAKFSRLVEEANKIGQNMGKGTCAMNKRTRKTKTGDAAK